MTEDKKGGCHTEIKGKLFSACASEKDQNKYLGGYSEFWETTGKDQNK